MTLQPALDPSLLHGVIDLGTHSCLLLVGRRDDKGELKIVLDLCEIPRLGEGLAKTGALSQAGMDRTVAVLKSFQARANELGVATLFLGGTAAMRRASNAGAMIERVRDELGLELTVIGESEEAELGWLAATAGLGEIPEEIYVVDVGGGSTEVVTGGGQRVRSFPLGGVVLTEAYGTSGTDPEGADWAGLEKAVIEGFAEVVREEPRHQHVGKNRRLGPDESPIPGPLLVALGGTACNYGALALDLASFDHEAPEGMRLPSGDLWKWARDLGTRTLLERQKSPIEAERAPVLPAGLACLAEVASQLGVRELLVTGQGLRYGLLRKRLS